MQAKEVFYFDFLFYAYNPQGQILGVCTLTQASTNPDGKYAKRCALAWAKGREIATGLRFRLLHHGYAGSFDDLVAQQIAAYGNLK